MTTEILLMWTAVTFYAAGAILYIVGFVFGWKPAARFATWVSVAGLIPHAAAIAVRWIRIGHAPVLGFYEVVSSYAFMCVLLFGLLLLRYPRLGPLGGFVMPIAFLMLGAAMFTPTTDLEVSGKLGSWWLTIHVTFAKLAYGSFIVSFALALLYLARDRFSSGRFAAISAKLPAQEIVDDLSYKFVAAGFIFLGIMIVAGAIWANEAWNRYWGWDAIETWSLIAWIVYAVYLHLRLTMGWRGRKAAWVAVAALPVVLFALVGVPIVYQSIHGAYLTGVDLK